MSRPYEHIGKPSPEAVFQRTRDALGVPQERELERGLPESAVLFERFPHRFLPTIGVEIELQHSQLDHRVGWYMENDVAYHDLPEWKQRELQPIFQDIDDKWLPRLAALEKARLRLGNDSYKEVITPPYYYNATLARLTNYLFDTGVLPEGGAHPLHITLGGIDIGEYDDALHSLARMVELLEGSTHHRVATPMHTSKPHWTQKSATGYLKRSSQELAGGVSGLELRALQASDAQQLARVLWRAQWLGAELNAWLQSTEEERQHPSLIDHPDEYDRQLLVTGWNGMVKFMTEVYELNGVDFDSNWGGPLENPQVWYVQMGLCSTTMQNQDFKSRLCLAVDDALESVEIGVLTHHRFACMRQGYLPAK